MKGFNSTHNFATVSHSQTLAVTWGMLWQWFAALPRNPSRYWKILSFGKLTLYFLFLGILLQETARCHCRTTSSSPIRSSWRSFRSVRRWETFHQWQITSSPWCVQCKSWFPPPLCAPRWCSIPLQPFEHDIKGKPEEVVDDYRLSRCQGLEELWRMLSAFWLPDPEFCAGTLLGVKP